MAKPNLNSSLKSAVQDAQVVTSNDAGAPRASSDTRAVARTGLTVLAVPIIRLLFERGAFGARDTALMVPVLR